MPAETLSAVLLWSALVHYVVLTVWFLVFRGAHDALYRLHGRWFALSVERFDALHYAAMSVYKIGVLLLFLVPGLVLRAFV